MATRSKVIEQSQYESKLEILGVCAKCTKAFVIPISAVHFSQGEDSCECCGSHGYRYMEFSCPDCGQEYKIGESW